MPEFLEIRPECAHDYLGLWLMEPRRLTAAVDAFRRGELRAFADARAAATSQQAARPKLAEGVIRVAADGDNGDPELPPYYHLAPAAGVATMRLDGSLMKPWPKTGGTSTVHARRAARAAMADDRVESVILFVDSPGGTSHGIGELAADLRALAAAKPLITQVDDFMASAGVYAGVQARLVFANPEAEVGSVGVYNYIDDVSKQYEAEGIKTYLVSTGGVKGKGLEGTAVDDELLDYIREGVMRTNAEFLDAIRAGRGGRISESTLAKINAEGKVYPAAEAAAMGLIDGVQRADETYALAVRLADERRRERERANSTDNRLRSARLAAARSASGL